MKFNKLTEKEKATIGVYRNSKISCYLCNKLQACGKKKASFGTDRSRLINGHHLKKNGTKKSNRVKRRLNIGK